MNQMLVKFHSASVFILVIDVLHYWYSENAASNRENTLY